MSPKLLIRSISLERSFNLNIIDKKELANIISEVLLPYGFKRKGSHWVLNDNELNKIVDLQKSNFGNYFYINYGFIINSIPLIGWKKHIFHRLGSEVKKEQKRINELLDFENDISDEIRAQELKKFLNKIMIPELKAINIEEDILEYLKKQPHLNDIPIEVKKYFNLLSTDYKTKPPVKDSKTSLLNVKKIIDKFFGR